VVTNNYPEGACEGTKTPLGIGRFKHAPSRRGLLFFRESVTTTTTTAPKKQALFPLPVLGQVGSFSGLLAGPKGDAIPMQ
jgi:hypothetical protein